MDDLRIIDDETLRARVRSVIAEPARKHWLERAASHPLATVIVGFLLTWGVGTCLSGTINRDREAREKRVVERRLSLEASLRSIESYASLLDEHRTRAMMFHSALARNARSQELTARRKAYEESYVKWGSSAQVNLLTLRNALGMTEFSPAEATALTGINHRFEIADSLLMAAYDRRVSGSPPETLTSARAFLDNAGTCTTAITNRLYAVLREALLAQEREAENDELPVGVPDSIFQRLNQACSPRLSGANGNG